MRTMDDWDLLQDYVRTRSDAAFGELVSRHIDWIYSVALRRVNSPELAEEITQSVFALLAAKAPALRSGTLVGGWLFRSACFVSKCSLRTERRRRLREETASAMMTSAQSNDTESSWQQLAPHLEQAVASLPESDRSAVLLRFYQRKSLSDVGQQMRISEEAAKKRVSRAVDKLRKSLARRGVTLGSAVLGTVLLDKTVQAAPPGLVSSIVKIAASGAAPVWPALTRETLQAWRWAKIKLGFAAGLCALVFAFVLYQLSAPGLANSRKVTAQSGNTSSISLSPLVSSNGATEVQPSTVATAATSKFLFRAVSAETGKGIPAARVPINYVTDDWLTPPELLTDQDGVCAIPLPVDKLSRLDVGVVKDGYVQKFYTWRTDYDEPLPVNYILKLERAVAIGGKVEDSSGKPISGASIALQFPEIGDASFREPARERLGFVNNVTATHTDAQGHWHCSISPAGYGDFEIIVKHPDFVEGQFAPENGIPSVPTAQRPAMTALWAQKAVLRLESGFQVKGEVIDDSGNPIADARVSWMGNQRYVQDGVKTKPDGTFTLGSLPLGAGQISAWAKGYAPSLTYVQNTAGAPQLIFRLNRGASFVLRIVDEEDAAISGAFVAIGLPVPHNADLHFISGPDGCAKIEGIPTNALSALAFHAGAPGYLFARDVRVSVSAPDPTIRLVKSPHVTGSVADAETHEPIADFKAIPCWSDDSFGYDRSATKRGKWGTYAVSFTEGQGPLHVRIEAEGYEPATSPPLNLHPSEQVQDFLLHKKETNHVIQGTVLLQDSQPAANVSVALLTFEQAVTLYDGRFNRRHGGILTTTDSQGSFHFEFDPQAHTLVAADPTLGFTKLRMHRAAQPFVLKLQPWGRIKGRVVLSGRPVPDREVFLTSGFSAYRSLRDGFYVGFNPVKTDSDGRFLCELMPPGDFTLYLGEGTGQSLSHQTVTEVHAGETAEVQLGGLGRRISGRLVLSNGNISDWTAQVISASLATNSKRPEIQPPTATKDLSSRLKLLDFFDDSEEWHAFERMSGSYPLQIAGDGTFTAEDIPAGPYVLNVSLADSPLLVKDTSDPTLRFQRKIIASISQEVVVPEGGDNSAPVDLGTFTAKSNLSVRK